MADNATHHWHFGKKIKLMWCRKCGLIHLKNKATEKAINKPCPDDKDV